MAEPKQSDWDRLITRPPNPLPTTLDPGGAKARGYPKNPKEVPPTGQGDPDAKNPSPKDIKRSA